MPKGVLFYGPPRTGKSIISDTLFQNLNIFNIFKNVDPGDFNNELSG